MRFDAGRDADPQNFRKLRAETDLEPVAEELDLNPSLFCRRQSP
jgi:hypothetical protein